MPSRRLDDDHVQESSTSAAASNGRTANSYVRNEYASQGKVSTDGAKKSGTREPSRRLKESTQDYSPSPRPAGVSHESLVAKEYYTLSKGLSIMDWYRQATARKNNAQMILDDLQKRVNGAQIKRDEWQSYGSAFGASEPDDDLDTLTTRLAAAQNAYDKAAKDLEFATQWKDFDDWQTREAGDSSWLEKQVEASGSYANVYDGMNAGISMLEQKLNSLEQQRNGLMASYGNETDPTTQADPGTTRSNAVEIRRINEEIAKLNGSLSTARRRRDMAEYYLTDDYGADARIAAGREAAQQDSEQFARDRQNWTEEDWTAWQNNMGNGLGILGGDSQPQAVTQAAVRPTDEWTEKERNRFYLLYDKDKQRAEQYAADLNRAYHQKNVQEQTQGWSEWAAGDRGWLGKVAGGSAGIAAQVALAPAHMLNWLDKLNSTKMNGGYYTGEGGLLPGGTRLTDYGNALVQGKAGQLNRDYGTIGGDIPVLSGKGLGDLYQLGASIAQSMAYGNVLGEAGTLFLFFGQAADSGYDEAINRGASQDQAAMYSVLSGAAEVAGEKFSLENLLDPTKNLIKQGFIEGSEEGFTDLLNLFNDYLSAKVTGGQTEIAQKLAEYMSQGMSYEEASKKVWKDTASDVAWDVIGGVISGGVSGGAQSVVREVTPYRANNAGQTAYGADTAQLAQEALDAARAGGEVDRKLQQRAERAQKRADAGKTVSVAEAGRLVKGTNRAAMVDAVENQIKDRDGEIEAKTARSLANAVVSQTRGDRLSENQSKLLKKHKELADTLAKELDIDKPAAWAQQIGARGEDAKSYGQRDTVEMRAAVEDVKNTLAVKSDDTSGTIVGVNTDAKGNVVNYSVRGEDGNVRIVKAADVKKTRAQSSVIRALADGAYAEAKIDNVKSGQNIGEYSEDFELVAELYGNGSSYENFEDAWKQIDKQTILTEEQARAAWDAGRKARDSADNRSTLQRKGSGAVSFESFNDGNTKYDAPSEEEIAKFKTTARYQMLEKIAKAAGVDLVFFKAGTSETNGEYRDGVVYLNMDASPTSGKVVENYVMLTAAHELTHYLREKDPAAYVQLKDHVVKHLIEKGKLENGKTLKGLINHKRKLYEKAGQHLSVDNAIEEIVADACEMMLKDNQMMVSLEHSNKALHGKVGRWMAKFVKKLQAAFEGVEATHAEAKAIQESQEFYRGLQKIWSEGVFGEGTESTGTDSAREKKLAVKDGNVIVDEDVTPEIVRQRLQDLYDGKVKDKSFTFALLKNTPRIFIEYCNLSGDSSFVMHAKKAYNAMKDNVDGQHQLGVDGMMEVIAQLRQPEYIVYQNVGKNAGHYAAIVTIRRGDIVAAVDLENYRAGAKGTVAGEAGNYNVLITAFDPEIQNKRNKNVKDYINDDILDERNDILYDRERDGDFEYKENEESPEHVVPGDTPSVLASGDSSKNNIADGKRSVKDKWDGVEEEAANHFGTTDDFRTAGYLMPDGRMLDFSGAHWLDGYDADYIAGWRKKNDIRQVDHEDVYEAFESMDEDNAPSDSSLAFIKRGNIRMVPEAPGIEISATVEPTAAQYQKIKEYIRTAAEDSQHYNSGRFTVDLTKDRKNHAGALRYEGKLNADRVVNDIKHYFETGEIREQSSVGRFRFSIRDTDAVTDRELLANTPLDSAQNDAEIRRLGDYKGKLNEYYDVRDRLAAADTALTEAYHVGDEAKIRKAKIERDKLSARLVKLDTRLAEIQATKTMQDLLKRIRPDEETRAAAATGSESEERKRTNNQLRADNEALRRTVDRLKRELKPTKEASVRREDARRIARDILGDLKTDVGLDELTDVIERMGNYLVQTETDELDDRTLRGWAEEAARDIVDSAEVPAETGMEDIHKSLRDYLRRQTLKIDKDSIADLGQETLQAWRRINPGVHVSTASGLSVDSAYQELQEMLGESVLPTGVTHPADQLNLIADLLQDSGKQSMYNPFKGFEREAAARIAGDIENAVYSEALRQTAPTFADEKNRAVARERARGKQALEAQKSEYQQRLQELREQNRRRIKDLQDEAQARVAEVRAREKAAKWEKVESVRQYYLQKEKTAAARRGSTRLRQKIRRLHADMSKRLLNPQENRYVPKPLLRSVAELLEAVNTDSGRSETVKAKLAELNAQYAKIKDSNDYGYAFDDTVQEMLQKLTEELAGMDNTSIYKMSREQLQLVYDTMKAINHTVRTAVKLVNYETNKNIFEIAKGMMQETDSASPVNLEMFNKWLNASLRPETFFKRMAGYRKNSNWSMMADMLDTAQLKQTQIQMEGTAIFEELMKDTKALDAMTDTKKLYDIGLKDKNGDAVLITMDMALMIYLHTLNEQNVRHLVYGGLTVPDMKKYYNGKASESYARNVRVYAYGQQLAELGRALREAETTEEQEQIQAQIDDIEAQANDWVAAVRQNILDQMGEYEHAWVKAAMQFFNGYSQRVLNETTMAVYGFEKATVENYVPIHTDAAYRTATFDSISRDMSLENSGFMKARVIGAANPMLAEGLVDVVAMQIDNVAKYAAMMPAVRNFQKVYGKSTPGYTGSIQESVRSKFGTSAQKYIENIITDLTSPRRTEGGMLGEYADKLRGNLAQASLTLNPRVTLGQAASYPTAAAVIGWKPLVKALKEVGSNPMYNEEARQEIAKWSPLLWYRMQGFFDQSVGEGRESWTGKMMDKAKFLTGWIEAVDGWTVGQLWYAAQAYVEDNTSLERGSDAFMEETAKVFNRIVEQTQPNYTTFQRPDILRNPNAVVKQLTMFMTQRLQNVNILFDAVGEYNAAVKDYKAGSRYGTTEQDLKEAKLGVARAVTSQLAAAATITAFKLFADMLMYTMKGYRDDDKELTNRSILLQLLQNGLESLASNFLWGSEMFAIAKSLITGERYYGISLNGVDTFNKFLTDAVGLRQDLSAESLWKLCKDAAQVIGIPLNNLSKFYNAVAFRINDAKNGEGWGTYASEVQLTDEDRGRQLYNALVDGNDEKAGKIYEYFGNKADANEQVAKHIKKLYADDELTGDEAETALQEYAGVSVYDSTLAISKLSCEKDTGIEYDDIKTEYLDGNISQDQAAEMRAKYGLYDQEEAEATVQQWKMEKDTGYTYDDMPQYIAAGDMTKEQAIRYRIEYGGQDEDAATKTVSKWMCEVETGIPYTKVEDYYAEGIISKDTLVEYYQKYWLYDKEKAMQVADKREFIGTDNEMSDVSVEMVRDYYDYCDPADIDRRMFYEIWKTNKTFHADIDDRGKTIAYSKAKKQIAYIDSLDLTPEQKSVIATALGVSKTGVKKYAPWL